MQGDGEKNAETVGNEANCEAGQMHQVPSGNNDSPYPLHTTIMCCPHHSCMLSPISPIQHLPSQAVAATGLARSCISLHGYPAANCSYPPNSPLIYSSPIVYNTARRSSSARLQRWNSLDANLTGLSHGHQPNGVWGNEAAWSRPSLLDDSYGSEAGLYPGPRGCERALRPGFSCQSHHGGMFSPFCRSYEYNIWGQGQNPNQGSVEHLDSTGSPSASSLQIGMAAQSTSSLALNINESTGDQTPQNKKWSIFSFFVVKTFNRNKIKQSPLLWYLSVQHIIYSLILNLSLTGSLHLIHLVFAHTNISISANHLCWSSAQFILRVGRKALLFSVTIEPILVPYCAFLS